MADTQKEFAEWPLKKGVRSKFLATLRSLQNGENDAPGVVWMRGFDVRVAEIKISGYRLNACCDYGHAVVVVSAYKKDSASGSQTRQHEVDLIKRRLKMLKEQFQVPTRQRIS